MSKFSNCEVRRPYGTETTVLEIARTLGVSAQQIREAMQAEQIKATFLRETADGPGVIFEVIPRESVSKLRKHIPPATELRNAYRVQPGSTDLQSRYRGIGGSMPGSSGDVLSEAE